MKTDDELRTKGFTDSGRDRYKRTAGDYCDALFAKAIALGEADKADGLAREVTHDHVKAAAHGIAGSYGKEGSSRLAVGCQIGEYICAATAGVGGNSLAEKWGIVLFGMSLVIGTVLFVIRNTKKA